MLHDDRSPDTPTGAAGDSIILHVPACVQRFSSRRRVLSRLRALARRRSRALPEPEIAPVSLQVEENPNWPAGDENRSTACRMAAMGVDAALELSLLCGHPEQDRESEPRRDDMDAGLHGAAAGPQEIAEAGAPAEAYHEREDPNAVLIQQLVEDNQDLKAALCRLIRISEQNHEALRLLEEENEELSGLIHQLTIGEVANASPQPVGAARQNWSFGWGVGWLRQRLAR